MLNLSKGDTVVVKKEEGGAVQNITVGVNWGKINRLPVPKTGLGFFDKLVGKAASAAGTLEDVDLDLTVVTFDSAGNKLDECAFYRKVTHDGIITHTGDDRGGDDEDDGLDNERIKIQGLKLATQTSAQSAFIILNSYSHQKFDEIPYIRLGIYDGLYNLSDKAPRLMEFNLTNDKQFAGKEGLILARLDKTSAGWTLKAIGEATDDRSIAAIITRIKQNHL